MPFYKYESEKKEKKEEIELFLTMSEFKKEIEIEGKIYYHKPEFSGMFHLHGNGWSTKGSEQFGSVKKTKEVGIAVDYNKARAYESIRKNKSPQEVIK